MLIEVLAKEVAYVGNYGEVRDIPEAEAKVLIALGKARRYVPADKKPEPVTRSRRKKKRTYKRRDVASSPQTVVMNPEVASIPDQWISETKRAADLAADLAADADNTE